MRANRLRRLAIDTAVVIGALGTVIGTLAGTIAMLYRAQVAALRDQLDQRKEHYEQRLAQQKEQYEARLQVSDGNCADWKAIAQETTVNLATLTKVVEANEVAEWEREQRDRGGEPGSPPPPLRRKTPGGGNR